MEEAFPPHGGNLLCGQIIDEASGHFEAGVCIYGIWYNGRTEDADRLMSASDVHVVKEDSEEE